MLFRSRGSGAFINAAANLGNIRHAGPEVDPSGSEVEINSCNRKVNPVHLITWAVSNSKCNTQFNERLMALPGYG